MDAADERANVLERRLARLGKTVALGRVTPSLIHEINNPLFAVLGLVELLLADAEPGSKAHERLELVQRSGQEIREIVGSLLAFAREPADVRERLDLGRSAEAAVALHVRTSTSRVVTVRADAGEEPLPVEASPSGVSVALLALLANAEQALPGGGAVTVEAGRAGAHAVVRVHDDGAGVPADVAPHVFEPFFTTREGAAGIGLTIARALAREHGGDVDLEAARPATFALRLPLAAGA